MTPMRGAHALRVRRDPLPAVLAGVIVVAVTKAGTLVVVVAGVVLLVAAAVEAVLP